MGLGFQRTVAEHVALQIDAESYTPWTQEDTFFANPSDCSELKESQKTTLEHIPCWNMIAPW